MAFTFNEVAPKIKTHVTKQLWASITRNRYNELTVQTEDGVTIQSNTYGEIGPILEEALRMTIEEDIKSIKTFIITEEFMVIEVVLEDEL